MEGRDKGERDKYKTDKWMPNAMVIFVYLCSSGVLYLFAAFNCTM